MAVAALALPRLSRRPSSNGVITITRDQILMALANGEVEIEV